MTKSQTRTYQAQTVTPPALKPARLPHRMPEMHEEQTNHQHLDPEDRQQKLDIITRLIDCIKSI
jgi:hypothetical protein